MAENTHKINAELKEYIRLLRDSYNLYAVILFGSYAQDMAREYSDIDIFIFKGNFAKF